MKRPPAPIAREVECELAENPVWDPVRRCILWTDITAGRIHALKVATGHHQVLYQGQPVGGFTLQSSGDLLLFRVSDIALLQRDGRVSAVREFSHDGMHRFNDVIADPQGRVFAGTLGDSPKCGLYRLNLDGTITHMFSGTGCSNGMGFSPDLARFYWTCSTTRTIYQFDYDRNSGELGARTIFYQVKDQDEGIPDGLTVDSNGNVWSARWGAASIVKHGLDGKILARFQFPATNVSSLCYYGEALSQIFVTSAQLPGANGDDQGRLFQAEMLVRGLEEYRSRINLSEHTLLPSIECR